MLAGSNLKSATQPFMLKSFSFDIFLKRFVAFLFDVKNSIRIGDLRSGFVI